MPEFSKYSAFFDSLSDEESYHKYTKELETKSTYEREYSIFNDKTNFVGEVLLPCQECTNITALSEGTNNKVYVTKMRVEDASENMNDHPSTISDPLRRQQVTDMHQTAYITVDPNISTLPKPGDKVDCFYQDAGPNDQGKMRGLRFKPDIIGGQQASVLPSGSSGYFNGNEAPLGTWADNDAEEYTPDNYQKPDESFLQRVYESFGLTYERPVVGDIRILSVRFPIKQANLNQFSDVVNVFYSSTNGVTVKNFQITTIPGQQLFGEEAFTKTGTSVAATGYTDRQWSLGKHRGKYAAGVQYSPQPGGVRSYYARDNNRNGFPDSEPGMGSELLYMNRHYPAHNFHRARASGTSTRISSIIKGRGSSTWAIINGVATERKVGVSTWSAGCQVMPNAKAFGEVIKLMQDNKQNNKIERYDYFLLDYEEYLTIKNGGKIDGVSKMNRRKEEAKSGLQYRNAAKAKPVNSL